MKGEFLSLSELESGLEYIRQSPKNSGILELIVCRPRDDEREILGEARLDENFGLVGDNWKTRGSRSMPDGSANPEMQINIMNARVIALVAKDKGRWSLAGDQLYLDMDLSSSNLPPGSQIALGTSILEITAMPHTACRKFSDRFGRDATIFLNSPLGKELNLRGLNAKVIQAGVIRVGDLARKLNA